jgi:type I restriction enzyme S subunit
MAETLYERWVSDKEYDSSIKDLVNIQNGYAFKSKDFQEFGSDRILKIKNISRCIVDIQITDFVSSKTIAKVDDRFFINEGDVLFAMTGAKIGKMGIIPKTENPLWLNQRVGLFKEKYKGARFFAYLHLKSDWGLDYIENTATGSAQPNISRTGIESCEFPKFGYDEIKEYSEQLGLLFDGVIFNLGKIHTLQSLRDTLLPKLMSGEVRVTQ